MEFLFIIPFLLMLAGLLKVKVYDPFASGTLKIDHLKHPMLSRTQLIVRYRNVTAREREQKFLAQARVKKEQQAITQIANESFDRLNASQTHHKELTDFFDKMFHEYDAPDREVKRLEAVEAYRVAAEEKRAKLDEYEKRRVRELEMWTIAEKKRIDDFKAEQTEIEKNARIDRAVEAKKLEEYYAAAQNLTVEGGIMATVNTSYGDRSVVVHGVYARLRANKSSNILNNFAQYDKISVDGWTVGEELYGNPIWFHQKPAGPSLAGWIWSGALNNQSTSGLPRTTDKTELRDYSGNVLRSFTQNSENAIETLSQMHANPQKHTTDREIAELQSEIAVLDERINPTPTPTPTPKDIFDNPWNGTISANKITANRISI